ILADVRQRSARFVLGLGLLELGQQTHGIRLVVSGAPVDHFELQERSRILHRHQAPTLPLSASKPNWTPRFEDSAPAPLRAGGDAHGAILSAKDDPSDVSTGTLTRGWVRSLGIRYHSRRRSRYPT